MKNPVDDSALFTTMRNVSERLKMARKRMQEDDQWNLENIPSRPKKIVIKNNEIRLLAIDLRSQLEAAILDNKWDAIDQLYLRMCQLEADHS